MEFSFTPNLENHSPNFPAKRPPEDEREEFDLQSATLKRHAIEGLHGEPTFSRASSEISDKSPEELVTVIQEMEATHAREMAEIKNQYANVSYQLEQLMTLLNNHFASHLAVIHDVQKGMASIRAAPPASATTASNIVPSTRRASRRSFSIPSQVSVPANGLTPTIAPSVLGSTPRQETPSFTAANQASGRPSFPLADAASRSTVELKITPSPLPNEPPTVEPSKLGTVHEVWHEYCYGGNGNPPLESLDALWGARWRNNQKLRGWYGRRKVILDKIQQYIADGIDEETAVAEVEKMRRGRTLNWLSRILLEDRQVMKKQRKEAQNAAKAAKAAMTNG